MFLENFVSTEAQIMMGFSVICAILEFKMLFENQMVLDDVK